MSRIDSLLAAYGESHQHSTNKRVHWICVPAIVVSLLGLIWSLPVPEIFRSVTIGPLPLNWAVLFIILTLIYYFRLSVSLALGMLVVTGLLLIAGYLLATLVPMPLWATSLVLFVLAWVGQFWGHRVEGKKPSFLKDIQFLLIGPVWLLSFIYRKLGIAY